MRVTADIRSVGNVKPDGRPNTEGSARILLNDLSIKGVGIFCTQRFSAGQDIAIQLTEPSPIYLRGKIAYCQEYDARTHVIFNVPYSYRIGIKFVFEDTNEEATVKAYCEAIFKSLNSD